VPRGVLGVFLRVLASIILLVAAVILLRALLGDSLLVVEASSISQILRLFGVQHVRIGRVIYVPAPQGAVGFSIEWHCSGFVTLMFYTLLLLLVPISSSRRLLFIALGFPAIYFLNAVRIALVVAAANVLSVAAAAAIHTFVGPLILVGSAVLLAFSALREEIAERRLNHASQSRR